VNKPILVTFVIMLWSALLTACADVPALLRRHSYPPNFKYITDAQLHSVMWQLAADVNALDALMRRPGPIDAPRRMEVERLLTAMRDASGTLEVQGRPTNHPLISDHLSDFRRNLVQALNGVESEPPNYYLVGAVSGACLPCHSPA
jgi:hypothetical protein